MFETMLTEKYEVGDEYQVAASGATMNAQLDATEDTALLSTYRSRPSTLPRIEVGLVTPAEFIAVEVGCAL
jgi:hypothetical protein